MNITGQELKRYIEQLENLEENIEDLRDDVKEVLNEAKNGGFDIKILKMLLKERKMEVNKLEAQQALLETYRAAINGPYKEKGK